jgi:hypothetical protein
MGRIAGVPPDSAGLFARIVYWFSRRKVGKVTEPIAVMAHNDDILQAYVGFERGLQNANAVLPKLKTLGSIKVAALVGCPF